MDINNYMLDVVFMLLSYKYMLNYSQLMISRYIILTD